MAHPMRPILRAAPYRAWGFAVVGTLLSLLPTPVALVLAVLPTPTEPRGLRVTLFVVLTGVLLACCGLFGSVRGGCVRLANHLLDTELPAPVPGTSRSVRHGNRLRTAAWLPVHAAVGWVVVTVTGLLAMVAATLVAVWLDIVTGSERIQLLWVSVDVAAGWSGAWTVLAAVAALVLAAYGCLGARVVLRALAPAFLGHGRTERLAALEEERNLLAQRNRLAQELHDSIGHTLTTSTIQAAVAGETLERDPASARRALSTIEESSRRAMDDLDHVLGVLRAGGTAPTAPPRSLTDVPALVDGVRRTGTEVRAELSDDLARVPATVSREAYRVVQEGLTNALRHARGAGPLRVRVTVSGDELDLTVTNPLSGAPRTHRGRRRPGRGLGLAGIEERVLLLRGEVSAGPVEVDEAGGGPDGEPGAAAPDGEPAGGQWRLAVRIPLRSVP